MNDAVLIDLAKYMEREQEQDSFQDQDELINKAIDIEEQYLSDPHAFAEITERLYHNNLNWPIEERITRMILAYRENNMDLYWSSAFSLMELFEDELKSFSMNIAYSQVKLKMIND